MLSPCSGLMATGALHVILGPLPPKDSVRHHLPAEKSCQRHGILDRGRADHLVTHLLAWGWLQGVGGSRPQIRSGKHVRLGADEEVEATGSGG